MDFDQVLRDHFLTIAEETSASSLVQSHQTQVLHNPHSGTTRCPFHRLGNFTLDLESNLDNFQGIREDLHLVSKRGREE